MYGAKIQTAELKHEHPINYLLCIFSSVGINV